MSIQGSHQQNMTEPETNLKKSNSFHFGSTSKRIGSKVKQQPMKMRNFKISENDIEAELVEENGCQCQNGNQSSSGKVNKNLLDSSKIKDLIVCGVKNGDIKSVAVQKVANNETIYRELSAIPYIFKCIFQVRKCRNLHNCAKINKKFKLFFRLTVGGGRRVSQSLMEIIQNEGGGNKVGRTAAFIAASAVGSRPSTILVPALPKVVERILPAHHSNLLMELVAETEELENIEKKTISDAALLESLRLKRKLIAKKARYSSNSKPVSSKSTPTTPYSEHEIVQSVLRNPFMYKFNKIIPIKSKVDQKFIRENWVSILPKGLPQYFENDENKSTGTTENLLADSRGARVHDADIESNTEKEGQINGSVNQIHRSLKRSVSSIGNNDSHSEPMEPL